MLYFSNFPTASEARMEVANLTERNIFKHMYMVSKNSWLCLSVITLGDIDMAIISFQNNIIELNCFSKNIVIKLTMQIWCLTINRQRLVCNQLRPQLSQVWQNQTFWPKSQFYTLFDPSSQLNKKIKKSLQDWLLELFWSACVFTFSPKTEIFYTRGYYKPALIVDKKFID